MTDVGSVNPVWTAPRESADRSVNVTPCDPVEMRLLDVRIPWEPSSFVEDSDRKNVYFELKDSGVIAFLQHQEDMLAEEGGLLNSCLAKPGLLRCKSTSSRCTSLTKTDAPQTRRRSTRAGFATFW